MSFKPNARTWMTFGVVFAWYAHSCQTSRPQSEQQSFELSNAVNLETPSSSTNIAKRNAKKENQLSIAHPKKPDAWHTRKLIMSYAQPSPARIIECKETVESAAVSSKNLRDLDEASLSIGSKVQQNKAQYHWCFYQLMTDLDLRLERDGNMLTEKSEAFLSRMRTLWVLAKALDASGTDEKTYNNYLRARYMEISQHQFGRTVEVIDPDALMQTAGKSGKKAENYEDPE